jgi:hypothetical protein
MNISNYGELLAAARSQSQPQRMLFAFARAEKTQESSGSLLPVMCVDKTLAELGSFEDLVAESRHMGADWDIVFVSSLSGRDGKAPAAAEAEAPLNMMVTYIHTGQIERFLAFSKDGELLSISQN